MAFLDLLIECAENGVVLSDEEVREQVDTIMFEVCYNFLVKKTRTQHFEMIPYSRINK